MPTLTKKNNKKDQKPFVLPSEEEYLTNISYDAVIFGYDGKDLKIVVLEYHNTGYFALPGGFIRRDESLNEAAKNGVIGRTGLSDIYLEQFHTFGRFGRDNPKIMQDIMAAHGHSINDDHWLLDRFLSIGYYALIDFNKVTLVPDALSDSINWYSVEKLPQLMMDHNRIVQHALVALKRNLDQKLAQSDLLPSKFTMKELKTVYEMILGQKIRRTSFQRKMLSSDFLIRHEKRFTGGAHKAPFLYSFNKNLENLDLQ